MIRKYYKCLPQRIYQLGNYRLEAVQLEHIEKIRQWRNEQIDVLRQNKPISKEKQFEYFNNHVWPEMDRVRPNKILLSIKLYDELIGYGGLVNISWTNLRGEISFLLDTKRKNNYKTYHKDMKQFFTMIKEISFNQLSFNRLFTETFDFREKHIKILEEIGLINEGRLRKQIKYNNNFYDSIIHSIIRNDISRK